MTDLIGVFENYVILNPYSDSAQFTLANIYQQRGDVLKAFRLYKSMEKNSIKNLELRYNIAICHYFFSRDFSKYQKFAKSAEIDPIKSREIAISIFTELAEHPDFIDANIFLGSLYMDSQENEKAVYHFRKRVKKNFGDKDFYYKEAMKGLRKIFEKDTVLLRKNAIELNLLNE
jgi:pentatricopeptide repeat protein